MSSPLGNQISLDCIDRPVCDTETAAIVRQQELDSIRQEQERLMALPDKLTYRPFWDDEKYEYLLILIARGASARKAAKVVGISTPNDIFYWVVMKPEFGRAYLEACQSKCMYWADELVDLADDCPADIPSVAKCRQQIDVRKFMLSKIVPKVFGEKLQVNHDVKGSPQVNIILPGKGGKTPDLPPAPPDATATIPPPALVIEMDNQNDVPSANQVPEKKYKKSRKTKPD